MPPQVHRELIYLERSWNMEFNSNKCHIDRFGLRENWPLYQHKIGNSIKNRWYKDSLWYNHNQELKSWWTDCKREEGIHLGGRRCGKDHYSYHKTYSWILWRGMESTIVQGCRETVKTSKSSHTINTNSKEIWSPRTNYRKYLRWKKE